MKLEGELAFFHSNIGHEPESQSLEFSGNDLEILDSPGYKLQNQKVKEYENSISIDFKKNKRDLDVSSYDRKSVDCITPKLEFYDSAIDMKNDYKAQVQNFIEPMSHASELQNQKEKEYENSIPFYLKKNERDLDLSSNDMKAANCTPELEFYDSMNDSKNDYVAQVRDFESMSYASKDIDSFVKFPNDAKSVKRSPTSPILNPPEERHSCQNSEAVCMDKTVRECKPEVAFSFKESNYQVVKDICVDEGVPTKDKVLYEMNVDEKAFNFFPSKSSEDNKMKKDNIGINVLNLPATEESELVLGNHDLSMDMTHKDEALTEENFGNVNEETLPREKVLLQDLDKQESKAAYDKGKQVLVEPELDSNSEGSKNKVEEAVLASPTLASPVDEANSDNLLLESGSFLHMYNASAPAACGKEECNQIGCCKCSETQNTFKIAEIKSDDAAITSQVRDSLGESSFSAVGPVSSRINYSGPVPYSGSISLRSDSSTTSTRSFAFPVLQPEWNSSPVRMAKAERSNYRKHRGWQGLLCCRF